jgi:O-antigen/teichoic acid export membrane protein
MTFIKSIIISIHSLIARKSEFGETLRHTRNYLTANVATSALGLLSIPVLTRLLSPDDYGTVNVFRAYIRIMVVVFPLNAFASVARYYYEETEDFRDFMGSTVLFSIVFFSIFSLAFVLFAHPLSKFLGLPAELMVLAIPVVLAYIVVEFYRGIFEPRRISKRLALLSSFRAYSIFGGSVLVILLLKTRLYRGPILAELIIGLIFAVIMTSDILPYVKWSVQFKYIRYMLKFSIPMIPYALGGFVLAQFDRIMINSYKGATSAGLYSLANNIGMLVSLVTSSISSAFIPQYFKYINSKSHDALDRDVSRLFQITLLAASFLAVFGQELGMVLASSKYYEGLRIVPIVVLGYIFHAIYQIYGRCTGVVKKPIFDAIILFICGFVSIGLNVLLIPRFGYAAGAVTSVISYFCMAFLGWVVNKFVVTCYCTPLSVIGIPVLIVAPLILFSLIIPFVHGDHFLIIITKTTVFSIYFIFTVKKIFKINKVVLKI